MSNASQKKMELVSGLIIFSILGAVTAGLYFTFGQMRPLHYDDPPYLSSRTTMTNKVLVAREAAEVGKPLEDIAVGKNVDFAELVQSGRFFFVSNGTGVTVLERGSDITKVRIRQDGREGYVHNGEIIAE
jgi:hypothetical protein